MKYNKASSIHHTIKRLSAVLLIMNVSVFSATAATVQVPLSPYISNGGGGSSGNKASNVWLTIDDSISMGALGLAYVYDTAAERNDILTYCKGGAYPARGYMCDHPYYQDVNGTDIKAVNGITYGYVPYDANYPYEENIPVDHLGNQLPLPASVDETYKLRDDQGTPLVAWSGFRGREIEKLSTTDIFTYYAIKNMGVKYRKQFLGGYQPYISSSATIPTIKINETYKSERWVHSLSFLSTKEDTCDHATNKKRCQVWKTYYSTRMLTLKSALALAMHKYRNANIRLGFTELIRDGSTGSDGYDTPYIHRNQLFPLKANYGSNHDNNRKAFYKWLFTLAANNSGTQTRETMSHVFKKIKENADSTGAIWLDDPARAHNSSTNPARTCRLNHNIVFTDGAWNVTSESTVTNNLADFTDESTESTFTLPDGIEYDSTKPYAHVYKATPTSSQSNISDIAFRGWITDLDDDSSNNNAGDDGAIILRNTEQKKYTATDGSLKIYTNDGSEYWHHFNDPATWQHINTHTIGFNLKGRGSDYRNIQINPPHSIAEANALDDNTPTSTGLNQFIAGNKQWKRTTGTTGRRVVISDMGRAAIAGRGLYFNSQTADDVIKAFDKIFATIELSGNVVRVVKGSSGAAGISQNDGHSHYATQYDLDSFTGELIKTKLYNGQNTAAAIAACFDPIPSAPKYGQQCTKSTAKNYAGSTLTATAVGTRKIISMKRLNNTTALNSTQYENGIPINNLRYNQIAFAKNQINQPMKKRLTEGFPTLLEDSFSDDDERLTKLINYVKGDSEQELTNLFRKREVVPDSGTTPPTRNILGATIRSSPVFTGIPRISSSHPDIYTASYVNFIKRYMYKINPNTGTLVSQCTSPCSNPISSDYVNMIYMGANDGMLHAFRADTLQEVFAYIPNAVYDNLPNIVDASVKQSLVDGGTIVETVNIVSGTPETTTWKQLLVGAMGGGGKGLYSLDVTNPQATDLAKWEYSDFESKLYQKSKNNSLDFEAIKSNIGNIIAKPAIIQLSDGTWAVVVGNGYNSESNKAALIVINADTGKPIQELVLDNSYTDNGEDNGLGPVYFAAYPQKAHAEANRIDRAYAGDLQGNLWVFDFSAATKNGGVTLAKQSSTAADKPLFVAKYTNTDGDVVKQPITVAPLVKRHPTKYGYLVHFGTGSLFTQNDLSSGIKNSIYAIWDDWLPTANGGLPTPRLGNVVERSHLQEVEYRNINGESITTHDGTEKKARILKPSTAITNTPTRWAVSGNDFTHNKRGWYVDLLVGERAWQSAYDTFGEQNVEGIGYKTIRYQATGSSTMCSTAGASIVAWRMAFNPNDGTQPLPNYGTLDLNSDGVTSKSDLAVKRDAMGNIIGDDVVSGFSRDNVIEFNSAVTNTYSPQDPNAPQRFCNYKTTFLEDSSGGVNMKQVCRESHSGSWTELK